MRVVEEIAHLSEKNRYNSHACIWSIDIPHEFNAESLRFSTAVQI